MAGGVGEGGVGGQGVFLGVVEVCGGREGDARVGFEGGDEGRAEVEGVVLCAGLEEDVAGGEWGQGEGGEEVGEEGGVDGGEGGGVGPEVEDVAFGRGLFVGEVEDVVAGGLGCEIGVSGGGWWRWWESTYTLLITLRA